MKFLISHLSKDWWLFFMVNIMSVPASYIGIIIIWSTTPLGIQWSDQGTGFLFGVALRMLIGTCVLLVVQRIMRLPFPFDKHSRYVYLASGLTIYVSMTLVYWSAQYIPSGWIAILFGLSPIVTGLIAARVLGEDAFGHGRWLGMLLGFSGLLVVFYESLYELHGYAWLAVVMTISAASIQSGGAVWIKYLKPTQSSLTVTLGGLLVSSPLFVITFLLGQEWPEDIPQRSLLSIIYLGVFGSALGFTLYFYVLKHLKASSVALITMITPVSALMLGTLINNEVLKVEIVFGTVLILSGLFIYQFGEKALKK